MVDGGDQWTNTLFSAESTDMVMLAGRAGAEICSNKY